MAYYNYKRVLYKIPNWFKEQYEKKLKEEYEEDGQEYEPDYDANYDGGLWLLAAAYIEHLEEEVKKLKGEN